MIRKKLLYIISLLALFSCTERFDSDFVTSNRLSTTISVIVPQLPSAQPHTRAMALNPEIKNLYLAIFDDNGYLLEYVKAKEVDLATENDKEYSYKVDLTPTDFRTTIHFIGNAPESLRFGTEVETVGSLSTTNNEDAYWQRVVLPNGIMCQDDGTLASEVQDALTGISLVRNFAWIQLKTEADNFSISSYCIMNTYDKGSIASYNTSNSSFVEYMNRSYADIVNGGYNGFIPAGAELSRAIPDESEWFQASGDADSYAYFVYEREKPLSDPPFILVKGNYTAENGNTLTNRYYKVDLRDDRGNYFPILRNFRYGVEITNVLHEGHASAEAAAIGAGSGDVSTAIETEDFTNISNNVARLFVSYTDTTIVESSSNVKLRYKFVTFDTDGDTQQILNGDHVEIITDTDGDVISSWSKATADDTEGWREISISTKELGTERKSQDIIVRGTATMGNQTYQLQRKVTISLRPKYTMQLECSPNEIPETSGSPFDLVIKVPGGLSQSMFPLEFELEADKLSITPNFGDDLPVVTGKSIIPGKNKTTIGFIKNVEWADYDALPNEGGYKSVPCHFKSNRDASATQIYAQNKYFNLGVTELKNYNPSTFSNLKFNFTKLLEDDEVEVEFTFTMSLLPRQGYVTITLDNLEPADDETRLSYIDVENGKARYSFNPTQTTETLRLRTSLYETVNVKLSAYHFVDATSTSWTAKVTIPAGSIKVGNNSNISTNTEFTLYTQDPGTSWFPGNNIANFTASQNGSNRNAIELEKDEYQAIMAEPNSGIVYVRFAVQKSYLRYDFYVAEVSLLELINDTAGNLNFKKQ